MFGLGVALSFLVGLFFWELRARKKAALPLSTASGLLRFILSSKNKSDDVKALIFLSVSALLFSLWEAFLRALIDKIQHPALVLLGVVVFVYALVNRNRNLENSVSFIDLKNLGAFWLGWILILGSWVSAVVFTLWFYLRLRFLRKAFS